MKITNDVDLILWAFARWTAEKAITRQDIGMTDDMRKKTLELIASQRQYFLKEIPLSSWVNATRKFEDAHDGRIAWTNNVFTNHLAKNEDAHILVKDLMGALEYENCLSIVAINACRVAQMLFPEEAEAWLEEHLKA